MRHEPQAKARYSTRTGAGGEFLTIPAPRCVPCLGFLGLWLLGWAGAGVETIVQLFENTSLPVALWLLIWVAGGAYLAATFLWMLKGRQELQAMGGNLEVVDHVPGYRRRKFYHGRDIRDLSVAARAGTVDWWDTRLRYSFMAGTGAVSFSYRQRICKIAPGVNEAEAVAIVDWLRKRLPSA